jgi:mercuric ion binding protein
MKKLGMLLMTIFFTSSLISAINVNNEDQPKFQTVKILTSSVCGQCKDRIEDQLNYTKGVVFAELNVDTKFVTVKFKTNKISLEDVKKVITDLGYDADDSKRNPEAFQELPLCCQSEGHCAR